MFFFQAEDGIRDADVTGVQTCALPICTTWSDHNRQGAEVDSFLEGPSFDRAGNLYFVDIPFGRVFRITTRGEWELVTQYDGWPNGLKLHRDGRIFIADYRRGVVGLDAGSGKGGPLLGTAHNQG